MSILGMSLPLFVALTAILAGVMVVAYNRLSDDRPEDTAAAGESAPTVQKLNAAGVLALAPGALLTPLVNVLPATWRIYHKLNRWSAWQMQKAASADALANVRRSNGQEDILPAKWVEGDEDEKDLTGWKVKGLGEKRFDPAVHGRSSTRFGKASIIHINEDDLEQGSWAEAAMDNAIQADREKYLFHDAELTADVTYVAPDPTGGANPARADGGANADEQLFVENVSVDQPGICQDALIPLASEGGYEGQVISWGRYSTLKSEQSDQQSLRDAKNSAWTAAKLDDIEGVDLLKWVVILGAIGAILLFHAEIGAFIAGLTNDGGAVGSAVSGGLGTIGFGGV